MNNEIDTIAKAILEGKRFVVYTNKKGETSIYHDLPTGQGAGTGYQKETYAYILAQRLVNLK